MSTNVETGSKPEPKISRVLSGGQSGSDRAALDAARALGIPFGGFIPKGRWSESGPLPESYEGMWETDHGEDGNPNGLLIRTKLNVRAADLTLIFLYGAQDSPGTSATERFAKDESRCVLVKPDDTLELVWGRIKDEIQSDRSFTINIAGPRESEGTDVYERTSRFLFALLRPHSDWSNRTETFTQMAIGQAMDNLRHWDTIRWLAPFFFWSMCGGVAFAAQDMANNHLTRIACLILAMIGCLSAYLLWKTYGYHQAQVGSLKKIGVDTSALGITEIKWSTSATLYFGLSIVITSVMLLLIGLAGPTRVHNWLDQSWLLSWLLFQ
ncbi:Putative molybdenum carrier [Gemmobacter aquatilis]|uniref:Putative molybdenum carrier n=1 Tax=Gemmobacter aquatilis TaxID=933059 RepID=A0A1H8EGR2_9RHOB|nr:putative molybdenum carrier protein [Gemmobacter aquatilis]SEN18606.1 Putative molybdenum carrier [Gemmobacter aquatilis]